MRDQFEREWVGEWGLGREKVLVGWQQPPHVRARSSAHAPTRVRASECGRAAGECAGGHASAWIRACACGCACTHAMPRVGLGGEGRGGRGGSGGEGGSGGRAGQAVRACARAHSCLRAACAPGRGRTLIGQPLRTRTRTCAHQPTSARTRTSGATHALCGNGHARASSESLAGAGHG